MRFTDASTLLLAAAAAVLAPSFTTGPIPFLVAAEGEASCPGGASANADGTCPNPDMSDVDESSSDDSEDSSDDLSVKTGNPNAHQLEDGETKPPTTCDTYLKLTGYKDPTYETKSFFQEVAWTENANKPDVCMSLDDILQICNSYRPHYHEPFVHFPAAYMKDFKRVVFVGGGDAMLLHESLKYPNVELVLGLELDQKVVRESLKHFHTQPHFDDSRVQWWFGDAAKSLALLPREWFGTFDLVMVDLSETAMSISVNDDLDIFGALALLMKPDGIFVKNELYYGQMSKLFDHSTFIYMDNYPILCDQDWAMGSNGVDFMRPKIDGGLVETNHVKTLEYTPLEDEDEHYKLIKDYSHNDARSQGKCGDYDAEVLAAKQGEPEAKEPVKPTRSAGILMVVEAENVTKTTDLDSIFKTILEASGFTPIAPSLSHAAAEGEATSAFFIGLEEGYISGHVFLGKSYVALEILLWSKISMQDSLRNSFLDVMGVDNSYSSYRVVHGGMIGHHNWRSEIDAIGPVKKNLRQCDPEVKAAEPQVGKGRISTDVYKEVVASSLMLLPKKLDKVVAVLCGDKGSNSCETADYLSKNSKVGTVVAIWDCPDTESDEESDVETDDAVTNIYLCGKKSLKRSAKLEEGFSALVVDPAATTSIVDTAAAEFCTRSRGSEQHLLLRDQVAFITPLSNDAEEIFFSRCVRGLMKHRVRSGRIVLDKTAEVGIIGSFDEGFVRKLVAISDTIEKKTGLRTMIDKMFGGPVQHQKQYNPEEYAPNSYSERDALRQYTYQSPLASQSVYQLQVQNANEAKTISSGLIKDALDVIIGTSSRYASPERVDFNAEVGDGSLSAVIVSDGHVIVTWDGAGRVTLNVMTVGEKYDPVLYGDYTDEVSDMVLAEHKTDIVDIFLSKLPASTTVDMRDQMPRGINRVVNFKYDINAVPGCADHYDLCMEFAEDGDCDDEEEQPWMQRYCALSCGACEEMIKRL